VQGTGGGEQKMQEREREKGKGIGQGGVRGVRGEQCDFSVEEEIGPVLVRLVAHATSAHACPQVAAGSASGLASSRLALLRPPPLLLSVVQRLVNLAGDGVDVRAQLPLDAEQSVAVVLEESTCESHVTRQTSHVTLRTSHFARHTSHVTRHTSSPA